MTVALDILQEKKRLKKERKKAKRDEKRGKEGGRSASPSSSSDADAGDYAQVRCSHWVMQKVASGCSVAHDHEVLIHDEHSTCCMPTKTNLSRSCRRMQSGGSSRRN